VFVAIDLLWLLCIVLVVSAIIGSLVSFGIVWIVCVVLWLFILGIIMFIRMRLMLGLVCRDFSFLCLFLVKCIFILCVFSALASANTLRMLLLTISMRLLVRVDLDCFRFARIWWFFGVSAVGCWCRCSDVLVSSCLGECVFFMMIVCV